MNIESAYEQVTYLVLQGLNINESIKLIGMDPSTLRRKLTDQQKIELYQTKTLNTIYGKGAQFCEGQKTLLTDCFPFERHYNYPEEQDYEIHP